MDYIQLAGKYPISKLWSQHNEHRVPFVKLLFLADLFLFHGNHFILIALNFFWQLAECAALSYFVIRLHNWRRVELVTVLAIAMFFVVNPNQLQNTEWAFSTFFNTFTFASLSIGGLCLYNVSGRKVWVIVSILSGVLAELSLASGFLCLAILPIAALLLGMGFRKSALFGLPSIAGLGIYLIGYVSPSNATSPLTALSHPQEVVRFLIAYFGESWHYVMPSGGDFLAAITIFGLIVFVVYRLLWLQPSPRVVVFLISITLVCVATGFMTSLGRQGDGVAQAREGRYQTAAMLFWAAIALLCVFGISRLTVRRAVALAVLQTLFCGAVLSEAAHLKSLYQYFRMAGFIRDSAGAALESGVDSLDWMRMIYPAPQMLPPTYQYLSTHGLMDPPLGMQSWMNTPLSQRFRRAASDSCLGNTDAIAVVGMKNGRKELYVHGWAFYKGTGPLSKAVATTEDGIIEGLGVLGFQRPDVRQALPQVTQEESGWNLYALVPPTARKLSVFAVIPGSNDVCELPSPNPIPSS